MRFVLLIVVVVVGALVPGACTPQSVTFNFGPIDQRLTETTVIDEDAAPKVLLIDVRGLIIDGPQDALLAQGPNPIDELVARLGKAEKDGSVKAIILRINSPGGSVSASDTMYREVRRFAEVTKKPVVASLGEVAASGGYYLALSADEIVAQPTSITGSIGVIIPTINVSDGLRRIGIVARSVKSGANKDLANPLEPMRDAHYAVLEELVDEFYEGFRARVVERRASESAPRRTAGAAFARRALDSSRIDELTDGRVVTGREAVGAGLADREGDVRDAFARAKELAGLKAAQMIKYHAVDDSRPRTAYAAAADLVRSGPDDPALRVLASGLGLLRAGNAYYIWMP